MHVHARTRKLAHAHALSPLSLCPPLSLLATLHPTNPRSAPAPTSALQVGDVSPPLNQHQLWPLGPAGRRQPLQQLAAPPGGWTRRSKFLAGKDAPRIDAGWQTAWLSGWRVAEAAGPRSRGWTAASRKPALHAVAPARSPPDQLRAGRELAVCTRRGGPRPAEPVRDGAIGEG
jgi:hypothetical protein